MNSGFKNRYNKWLSMLDEWCSRHEVSRESAMSIFFDDSPYNPDGDKDLITRKYLMSWVECDLFYREFLNRFLTEDAKAWMVDEIDKKTRIEILTGKQILYFNDYSEDCVMPRSGDIDLVLIYQKLMEKCGTPIEVFDNKDEMWCFINEFCCQARDGIDNYKHYDRQEMQELIDAKKS